jgi:hypothetical protein
MPPKSPAAPGRKLRRTVRERATDRPLAVLPRASMDAGIAPGHGDYELTGHLFAMLRATRGVWDVRTPRSSFDPSSNAARVPADHPGDLPVSHAARHHRPAVPGSDTHPPSVPAGAATHRHGHREDYSTPPPDADETLLREVMRRDATHFMRAEQAENARPLPAPLPTGLDGSANHGRRGAPPKKIR